MSDKTHKSYQYSALTALKRRTVPELLRRIFPAAAVCTGVLVLAPGAARAADTTLLQDCLNNTGECSAVPADFTPYEENGSSSVLDGKGGSADFSAVPQATTIYPINYNPTDPDGAQYYIQNFGSIEFDDEGIAKATSGGMENIAFANDKPFILVKAGKLTVRNTAFYNLTGIYSSPFIQYSPTEYRNDVMVFEYSSAYKAAMDPITINSFIDFTGSALVVRNSVFDSLQGSMYGSAIHVNSAQLLQIDKSRFNNNLSYFGGAFELGSQSAIGSRPAELFVSNLTIRDSYFTNNTATAYGGAAALFPVLKATYYISNTEFSNNRSGNGTDGGLGGAILIWAKADADLTIRDSTFTGNYAGQTGGAIAVMPWYDGNYGDKHFTINIISSEKDTVFESNIGEISKGADIYTENSVINLLSKEGTKISFGGDIIVDAYSEDDEKARVININKPDTTYTYYEWDESEDKEISTEVTADVGGEAEFKSYVTGANINLYGGTLTLAAPDASALEDGLLLVDNLKGSDLSVEGDAALKTRDAEALNPQNYTVSRIDAAHADAASLAENVVLQKIILGGNFTLRSTLSIQPAVDLSAASEDNGAMANSDKYALADSSGAVSGDAKLTVTGWIIKADNESLDTVYAALTDDEQLKSSFGLAEGGTVAVGPVHVWKVAQKDDDPSVYIFTLPEDKKAFFAVDEPEDNTETEPETGTDPAPINHEEEDEPESSVFTETEPPAAPVDTPFNYNPDIYAGQVAALSTGVIQHAIADSVFAEAGLTGNFFAADEKPERKPWWGKVRGADLNLKTKNFYGIDFDFALAMIGHQFEPIKTAAGDVEFGAYLGAATANAKYASNKVRQNGGFIGGSVLYRSDHAFAGAHANFGIMNNRAKGYSDNTFSTPWIGLGATAGYTFEMPAIRTAVTPLVDFSYVNIQSKDYTTGQGARVKNSNLNSFEVTPGVRVDKRFAKGWSAFGLARYAFVSKSSGSTTASVGTNSTVLPAIANKNYAEYGLGIQKEAKSYGVSLNVTRSDGGRSGWTGMIRAHLSF